MKNFGWRAWALFFIAFLITFIVTAPATLFAKMVEGVSNGQFVLANATGTMWQGSATPAIRQRNGGLFVLEKLHWDIALLPLLGGKFNINLRWNNMEQGQPMAATISFGQIELRNVVLPLHAGILGELSPLLKPLQLSGQMQLKSEIFSISKQGMKGSAVADWLNAGSVLSPVSPLGSYRINLAGAGERLDAVLVTTTGVLLLEGVGSFTPGRGLRFQGTARAAPDSNAQLAALLSNFGPESAPGVHTLNLVQ